MSIEQFKPACCFCKAPYRNSSDGYISIKQCLNLGCNRFLHPGCVGKGSCCEKPSHLLRHAVRVGKGLYQFVESSSVMKESLSKVPKNGNPSLDNSFRLSATCTADTFNATMDSLSYAMGGAFTVGGVTTTMAALQTTTTTTSAPALARPISSTASSYASVTALSSGDFDRSCLDMSVSDAPHYVNDDTIAQLFGGIQASDPNFALSNAIAQSLKLMSNSTHAKLDNIAADNLKLRVLTGGYFKRTENVEK